jgi:hypothetical protein
VPLRQIKQQTLLRRQPRGLNYNAAADVLQQACSAHGGRVQTPTADVLDTGNVAGSLSNMKQEEQLRLLSIFHYVMAGLSALFACIPIIHLTLGLFMVFAPETFHNKGDNAPPAFLGWFLVIFAAMFILIGWTFAAFIFTTGRFLAKRKHYMFCLVMGGKTRDVP